MIDLDKIAITCTCVDNENMFYLKNKEEENYFKKKVKQIIQHILCLRQDNLPPSMIDYPPDLKLTWNSGTAGSPVLIEFRIENAAQKECYKKIVKNLRELQSLALKNNDDTTRYL
jgi:hypothetical protein